MQFALDDRLELAQRAKDKKALERIAQEQEVLSEDVYAHKDEWEKRSPLLRKIIEEQIPAIHRVAEDNYKHALRICDYCFYVGIALSVFGFIFWYRYVQVYQDYLLKYEAIGKGFNDRKTTPQETPPEVLQRD